MKRLVLIIGVTLLAAVATSRGLRLQAGQSPLVERVGDTGFIQLQSPSFSQLDAKQKALAYWLTQASIAIDPIIYDQLSAYGLRQKRLLEGVAAHHASVPAPVFAKVRETRCSSGPIAAITTRSARRRSCRGSRSRNCRTRR